MSILTEYNEELHLKNVRKEGHDEGRNEYMVEQICNRLRKSKGAKMIAEELEEDIELVQEICEIAKNYSPDYDADKVYDALKAK